MRFEGSLIASLSTNWGLLPPQQCKNQNAVCSTHLPSIHLWIRVHACFNKIGLLLVLRVNWTWIIQYFSLCYYKGFLFFKVLIFGNKKQTNGGQFDCGHNICTVFPKPICVSKLCMHILDPKCGKSYQKPWISSLVSVSSCLNVGQIDLNTEWGLKCVWKVAH